MASQDSSRLQNSVSNNGQSCSQKEENSSDFQKVSVAHHGRSGLSSAEAEKLYQEVGYNELDYVSISAIQLFLLQFTGMMPFILEAACILSLAIQSYIDFAVIFAILLSNSILGFHEEIKAKISLVSSFDKYAKLSSRKIVNNHVSRQN